ncbi:MAG: hypothetical protein ABI165_10505 [Bryobacteraceae bacterium]
MTPVDPAKFGARLEAAGFSEVQVEVKGRVLVQPELEREGALR